MEQIWKPLNVNKQFPPPSFVSWPIGSTFTSHKWKGILVNEFIHKWSFPYLYNYFYILWKSMEHLRCKHWECYTFWPLTRQENCCILIDSLQLSDQSGVWGFFFSHTDRGTGLQISCISQNFPLLFPLLLSNKKLREKEFKYAIKWRPSKQCPGSP